MQKQNLIVVDDINLSELRKCDKALTWAKSWSDIFEHLAVRLRPDLSCITEQVRLLKATSSPWAYRCQEQAHEIPDHKVRNDAVLKPVSLTDVSHTLI